MFTPEFTIDDLDKYNFRSDARRLGRKYYDDELDDTRQIHDFIAHYANLLLENTIGTEGKITTTLHNEYVGMTFPMERGFAFKEAYLYDLRVALSPPTGGKRHFKNRFRNFIAGRICSLVEQAFEAADAYHIRQIEAQQAMEAESA